MDQHLVLILRRAKGYRGGWSVKGNRGDWSVKGNREGWSVKGNRWSWLVKVPAWLLIFFTQFTAQSWYRHASGLAEVCKHSTGLRTRCSSVLVSFPDAGFQRPDQSNFREEGIYLVDNSRLQPAIGEIQAAGN